MKSQYLHRRRASIAFSHRCYYCDRRTQKSSMVDNVSRPHTRTADHIHLASRGGYSGRVPTAWGGDHWTQIHNKRPCCYQCNQMRNTLGHCCGLLMLVLIEADARGVGRDDAMRLLWGQARARGIVARAVRHKMRRDTRRIALEFGV